MSAFVFAGSELNKLYDTGMSDQEPTPAPTPIITQRGLSDRSRQLLQGTQRTDPAAEAPRNVRPHRVMRSLWWPLLYFVLVMSFADVAFAPLCWAASSNWHTGALIAVCSGLIAAQAYVIALGLVFGRDSLTNRLGLCSVLLFLIFLYGTAGYFGSIYTMADTMVDPVMWNRLGGSTWLSRAGVAWCVLIAVLLGLITPLLGVHLGFGWRFTNADEMRECLRTGVDPPPVHRYGLRDLLMLMVLVSVIFAIPRSTYDPRMRLYDDAAFWIGLALAGGVAFGMSSLLLIFLWLLLHGPQPTAPRWAWSLIAYSLWALSIGAGIAIGTGVNHPVGIGVGLVVANLACLCGALIGLLIIRAHGWRIESTSAPLVLK